jgi:serine O-acetyltransferase
VLAAFRGDIQAAKDRDPAVPSTLQIVFAYPGVHAIWGHRVTHWLWGRGAKVTARTLGEITRILTGVDIHPGAILGTGVFIDHATGVVIGETAEVGDDVTIYHGVTLGGTGAETGKRHASIPDLVGISLQSLLSRVAKLESQGNSPQTGRVIRPPEAGVWHGEDFSI